MRIEERFWSKVDKSDGPDGCWIWTASRTKDGYGQFWAGGKMVKTHRFAYELVNGPIPDGLLACHRCDNPPCVNHAHLFLGTDADNMADRDAKGRCNPPRGEQHGARLHPERLARGERHGSRTHPERLMRGERHVQARLTDAQVVEIRADYAAGAVSQAELGRRYKVTRQAIYRIVRGKNWKTGSKLGEEAK